jgi:predicted outer membrane repeat protein
LFNQGPYGGTSSPTLSDVTFRGNHADTSGGGMFNWGQGGGASSPSITNVTFSGNSADGGAAMVNDGNAGGVSNPTLNNVTFADNAAGASAGGMLNYGVAGTSSPTLTNVTFHGNSAGVHGGAMSNLGYSSGVSAPSLTNVILWGDTAPSLNGPEIYNDEGTPSISYSIVEGGDAGSNGGTAFSSVPSNLNADPRLDPSGPANNGGTTQTIALLYGSYAIDTGTSCSANDQRGLARPVNSICDIGAYEAPTQAVGSSTCYVDASGSGTPGGGLSWSDPYIHLQGALADPNCSKVWVANGLYTPGAHRADTFSVPAGMKVYGGFAGGETLLAARNPGANVAVLSADIDNNDSNKDGNGVTPTAGDIVGSNAYHVVTMDGTSVTISYSTVLDGFTLSAGKANGGSAPQDTGGGLLCYGTGAGSNCSPTLSQLMVIGNTASGGGAGMMLDGSSGGGAFPALRDVMFSANVAVGSWGGGMFNEGFAGRSSPSLTNVTFRNNSAVAGGAMMNDGRFAGNSHATVSNATFAGNTADYGGAMYNFGAVSGGNSSPELMNVTFNGNSASTNGGAVYNDGTTGGNSSPAFTNVILWGDSASGGPEIYNDSGGSSFMNYSVVQGGDSGSNTGTAWSSGAGNLSTDPNLGTLTSNGGYTKTMALLSGSSAIGTGDFNVCAAAPVGGFDQRGVSRMACDIGAYQVEVEGVFDDNRPGWTFTGSWMMSPSPGAYNNTLHLARSAGATAEYTFTAAAGHTFSVTYLRKPGLGNLEVYLDSPTTPLTTIATAGPAKLLSYVGPPLTVGSHTVKLRRAGAGVVAFDLLEQIVGKGDDRSPSITYAGGGWTNVAVPAAYLGTLKYATVTNATASFGFTGSRFSLTAAKSPSWGNLAVYMDGSLTPLATVTYNATPAGFLTYTTPSLGAAAHTVVLKYVSASPSYVALDNFVIRP